MARPAESRAITQQEIHQLKTRRDQLLNTACNRFERPDILDEVKRINEQLRVLHIRLGQSKA